MNSLKLNDWLQGAAAIGVIAGLVLVAYELRMSNRISVDQAQSQSAAINNLYFEAFGTAEAADLMVRAHEGDELTRQEWYQLDNLINTFLVALYYDWTTGESGTIEYEGGFADFYAEVIQWYLGSDPARRKWNLDKGAWDTPFANIIDSALARANQRNVIGELDYVRGVIEQVD